MAVPPDADAPPPTAPPMALPILPTIPTIACLSRISVNHGQHGTGEAAPVMLTAGQHRRHILCIYHQRSAWLHFLPATYCPWHSLPTHSSRTSGLPSSSRGSWSSAAQVFFCSDMTLFSASGLSPYCSFRRCSVASRSACRSVSPRLFASMAARFARLLLCEFIRLLRQRVQALLIRNLVAKCSQLAFCTSSVSFSWVSRDFSCSDNCRFVAASFRTALLIFRFPIIATLLG